MSKVLVVDDDPDFVKVVSRVLQKAGHSVTSAANGERAMASMRKDVPDLVVLDMMMSYILDGLDVRRAMAEDPLLETVPVIMVTSVTAVPGSEILSTDKDAPIEHWLSKPVDPKKLLECVDQALA